MSDSASYSNDFRRLEAQATGLQVLGQLLAEVWDFDSDIATTKIQATTGTPLRVYYQSSPPIDPKSAPAGSNFIAVPSTRWTNYLERAWTGDPAEAPPLPPEATNSNPTKKKNGSDTPRGKQSTLPDVIYTHHLIRDFMFLDATAANVAASGPPPAVSPQGVQQFTVQFLALDPTKAADDSVLSQFTRGTNRHQIGNKYLVDPTSVPGNKLLTLFHDDPTPDPGNPASGLYYSFVLYQLVNMDRTPADATQFTPNWFGVAVPDGITDFSNVIIYFHASGHQAGYEDIDYPSKSASTGNTNWKEILGYVDRLGSQLAGAIKHSAGTPNQIVIAPIMANTNLAGKSAPAGILPQQWYFIVNDILSDLPSRLPSLSLT